MPKITKHDILNLGDPFVGVFFMEKIYFHAFNLVPHIGPKRINKLLKYFGNLQSAWLADYADLYQSGLENFVINKFLAIRKDINPEQEWNNIFQDIKVVTVEDSEYPKQLKEIASPPSILYVRGNEQVLKDDSIAIVGTRRMSAYGQRVCEQLTKRLTQIDLTVISGLADGIDTQSHKTCLINNGKTIAVLGSGINNNCVFPANNRLLAERIAQSGGAIISEYPPHAKAQRQFFPARNRIISGLSLGTIVIEAANKSGALITAYFALEQNKEVFAVPGSIFSSRSDGCHTLIKKGAKLVANIQDILEELPEKYRFNQSTGMPDNSMVSDLNSDEKIILHNISSEPVHIDKIIKSCRLSKSCALSALTTLELKGLIKNIESNHYIIWQKI